MYKCSKCGNEITEFDANFSKNLFGKFDAENRCECANCVANVKALERPKGNKKRKSKTIFYLLPYIIIASVVFVVMLCIKNLSLLENAMPDVWCEKLFGENWFSEILALIFGFVILFLLMLIPSLYVLSIVEVMGDLGVEDNSYEVDVYRTTYDSTSDSFTTTKGTESVGGPSGLSIIAGIIYPVWGIFALIIKIIRRGLPNRRIRKYIKNNFSKEVIMAYKKTKNETEHITISQEQCKVKQQQEYKYAEKCKRINNKYSYLCNKDFISQKIEKLKKPYVTLKSNKGTYYNWIDTGDGDYILLDRHNNERIYNGKYFYYTDDNLTANT